MLSLMEPFLSPSGCLEFSRNCLDVWLLWTALLIFPSYLCTVLNCPQNCGATGILSSYKYTRSVKTLQTPTGE